MERACCIRGYHVCKDVWDTSVGKYLKCRRELSNPKDRYTIAVLCHGTIVGHLPKKISLPCSLFIQRGGTILCRVTGRRHYSVDLLQGGLEIPYFCVQKFCWFNFCGPTPTAKLSENKPRAKFSGNTVFALLEACFVMVGLKCSIGMVFFVRMCFVRRYLCTFCVFLCF